MSTTKFVFINQCVHLLSKWYDQLKRNKNANPNSQYSLAEVKILKNQQSNFYISKLAVAKAIVTF